MENLKKVLEEHLSHIKIDKDLLRKLEDFKMEWVTSRKERIDFLSSHLIGVHTFRFTDNDESELLEEILDIDVTTLHKALLDVRIYKLEKRTRSNKFYLVLLYFMYKVLDSRLGKKDKHQFVSILVNLIGYRLLSSIMSQNFKFNLDEDVAAVVYERLTSKSLIKTEKNWQGVIDYYTSIFMQGGVHYKRLLSFKEQDVFDAKNDYKNRLKSIIKILNTTVYAIIENDEERGTYGAYVEGEDGKQILVDMDDEHTEYYKRIKSRIPNERMFVKRSVVSIVCDVITTVKEKDLERLLVHLTKEFDKKPKDIFSLSEEIVKVNIDYLYINRMYPPYGRDIDSVIRHIRGYWFSSSVKNATAKQIKTKMKHYAMRAVKKRSSKYYPSLANAAILYVFILAILDF